jgi:glyoxylase-like metal-dependent hydrolase (beta-lactamase superfamily II)
MTDFGTLDLPETFRTDEVVAYKPFDDLYLLQTRKEVGASIYVLIGSERALVLDTGMLLTDLTSLIRRVTDKPFDLALTHGHRDHIGSVDEFDHLYMNSNDRAMIPDYKGNVIEINNGYTFDLGGLTLEVIEMFGHTEGSIGFLDNKKRLFTGDAIGMKMCYMALTTLPLESLLGVLRHIESIEEKWEGIWNGHFGRMNKVLKLDYILQTKELTESIVRGDGKFVGQPDPALQARWKLDFTPLVAVSGEIQLIYNPNLLHYL